MRNFEDTLFDIITSGIPVCSIGQFDKKALRLLDKAVKEGAISKGKGGEYPKLTTVFAPVGFDFVAHRTAVIKRENDLQNGLITPHQYLFGKFDYQLFVTK